jgi:hypothetical protein
MRLSAPADRVQTNAVIARTAQQHVAAARRQELHLQVMAGFSAEEMEKARTEKMLFVWPVRKECRLRPSIPHKNTC